MNRLSFYLTFCFALTFPPLCNSVEQIEFVKHKNLLIPVPKTVYVRAVPTIIDHGDPTVEGSIAWAIDRYGGSRTYVLKTTPQNGSYPLLSPITLPEGVVMKSENAEYKALIKATGDLDVMIHVSSSTAIQGLIIDGQFKAKTLVKGFGIDDFNLVDSSLRQTKNENPNTTKIFSHILDIQQSRNIQIRDNEFSNAGYSGVESNPRYITASAMYLVASHDITVDNNQVSETVSAGVNTTNSYNIIITNNIISSTGRANYYALLNGMSNENENGFYAADGITAYHNVGLPAGVTSNYLIQNNTITNWYNHGIHIDGRSLQVIGNQVHSAPSAYGKGHAIFIGDSKTEGGSVCSTDISLHNNYVKRNPTHSDSNSIRVRNYQYSTYSPLNNTGNIGSPYVSDHRYLGVGHENDFACPTQSD